MSYTYLDSEAKKAIYSKFGGSATNTGSTDAQVAILTKRIQHLTKHLRSNKKDHATRLSLLKMVGQRRRFLEYIKHKDVLKYRALIAELGIRR
ncbi:MAG TPA: 30S ribosomal protein S15 [Chitinophagales bacterium]|nr:30S ribosomal protein S15 [Chitinophagales bacterium]